MRQHLLTTPLLDPFEHVSAQELDSSLYGPSERCKFTDPGSWRAVLTVPRNVAGYRTEETGELPLHSLGTLQVAQTQRDPGSYFINISKALLILLSRAPLCSPAHLPSEFCKSQYSSSSGIILDCLFFLPTLRIAGILEVSHAVRTPTHCHPTLCFYNLIHRIRVSGRCHTIILTRNCLRHVLCVIFRHFSACVGIPRWALFCLFPLHESVF